MAMALSLSVRIAESPRAKDVAAIPIEELARHAKAAGFAGLSMRASVVSVSAPPERARQVRAILDRLGLRVSMVTGDLPLAINNAAATASLYGVTPYLDLAECLGCTLLRVMMHHGDDIGVARRAADEAAERGMTLSHQMHWGSLFETVDNALDVLKKIDRDNFGVSLEPANMLVNGTAHGLSAVERLAPYLCNVYFQNICLDPASPLIWRSRRRGPVGVRYLALDDRSGIDAQALVEALKRVGYDGWFSVHQPLADGADAGDAIRHAGALFLPML
jgi:sugar phosphate isomerase/epimerase